MRFRTRGARRGTPCERVISADGPQSAPTFLVSQRPAPMDLSKIPVGVNPPYDVNAIIEIPQGGEPVKYEIDKESGALFVDRFLHTAMFYPGNYGFIPHTLADDGDPMDIMVVGQTPVVPGAIIRARPIGTLMMTDEAGGDEKVLAVPVDALHPFYTGVDILARAAGHPDRADRPLLPALQGPGEGQVGEDHRLGRAGADRRPDPRRDQRYKDAG